MYQLRHDRVDNIVWIHLYYLIKVDYNKYLGISKELQMKGKIRFHEEWLNVWIF